VAVAAAAAAAEAAMQAGDGAPASSLSALSIDTQDSTGSSSTYRAVRIAPPGFTLREVESFESFPHAGACVGWTPCS
jgi:hypothetical protein